MSKRIQIWDITTDVNGDIRQTSAYSLIFFTHRFTSCAHCLDALQKLLRRGNHVRLLKGQEWREVHNVDTPKDWSKRKVAIIVEGQICFEVSFVRNSWWKTVEMGLDKQLELKQCKGKYLLEEYYALVCCVMPGHRNSALDFHHKILIMTMVICLFHKPILI